MHNTTGLFCERCKDHTRHLELGEKAECLTCKEQRPLKAMIKDFRSINFGPGSENLSTTYKDSLFEDDDQ